ncbi:MAG: aminotransferase class I/II-fold pyridoxal phosphate-dependent enzyme [Actinomycetota bacterium]|nr:aminotransferase class I/II-fold pyridoxal phosphate-dependent enzyme [Actinomycetota bacterium]
MTYDLESASFAELQARESMKWSAFPPEVLPAFVAEMDFPLAEPVKAALSAAIERGDTGYANAPASGLGDAFAAFAMRRWSWTVDPAQVHATSDVVHGLTALLEVTIEPGDGVIVNSPVYYPFFSLIEEAGGRVVDAPLGEAGALDLDAIESAFEAGARVMLLCSPQNPTGAVPTREQLAGLAELAARYGAWILSDEIHAPLTLPGTTHTPFLTVSPAAAEHGICLTSASKTFNLAGLGCALMVTASDRAEEVITRLAPGSLHPGHLGVIAARAAFTDGDDWLDQVVDRLDRNRNLLASRLADRIPELSWIPPRAGYLAWLNCRNLGLGDDPATVILERSALALSSGPQFGNGGAGHCRLNFGTTPGLLEEAVSRLARTVR